MRLRSIDFRSRGRGSQAGSVSSALLGTVVAAVALLTLYYLFKSTGPRALRLLHLH